MERPILERGDRGALVFDLQDALVKLGMRLTEDDKTGFFNGSTEKAVRLFQLRRQMPITGIVTKSVWAEIDRALKEIQ